MRDAQKLLAAVKAIADNQDTAEQMGRRGRAAYLRKYNFDFCAAKFADWLEEAYSASGVHGTWQPARFCRP
jgi:glycosyltransferase involved in cell wall biosynthesis